MTTAETRATGDAWDAFVEAHPLACYLQLSGWPKVKAPNGWTTQLVETGTPDGGRIGGRLLLRRPKAVPWSFAYAPRGPLANGLLDDSALRAWERALRDQLGRSGSKVALVRIDPEIEAGGRFDPDGATVAALRRTGWVEAPEVQPSVTRVIDLTAGEEALWGDLRSKWRQYVGKAQKLGVTVEEVDADTDPTVFPTFHRIMTETSHRTNTHIRTEQSYRDVWDAFRPGGRAQMLFARDAAGEVQAVLFIVRAGTRYVEPYGGMTLAGAEMRANYLMKWEAIRRSLAAGGTSYDMWGLVHPGIRQFKEGFGGREVRLIGAWELQLSKLGATLYRMAEERRRPERELTSATIEPKPAEAAAAGQASGTPGSQA